MSVVPWRAFAGLSGEMWYLRSTWPSTSSLLEMSEMSTAVKDALELDTDVGPLSGKTLLAVAAWLISWVILHLALKDKDPTPRTVFIWVAIMFGVALLLTFPPIFMSFAAEE